MPKDNENIPCFEELPSQPTEPAGFSHKQMVRCDECLRANAPTRVNCLYCSRSLPQTEAFVALTKPALRPLESWEQGYNNILVRFNAAEPGEELVNKVSTFLRLEATATERLLSAKWPVPLSRTSTKEEALLVEQRLNNLGLETVTVADQDLQIDRSPPRRLRRLELRETALMVYQTGNLEGQPIAWVDISLVVLGRLFATQVELRERRSRKPEAEILDSHEFAADEAVVDVYAEGWEGNWRISANGFDFSCLGHRKALVAGENFPTLINLFRASARHAEFNDLYPQVRHCLEIVWPSEKRIESGGVRVRASRHSTAQIISTNSERQFTRYSRLYHYLKRNSLVQP